MINRVLYLSLLFNLIASSYSNYGNLKPFVIATWPMEPAVSKAWSILEKSGTALDSIEKGINVCESGLCTNNVGFGARPDENGETTLDALIMDGETHNAGAVGALRRIKHAISVARVVMEHTKHTLLVGSQATEFAVKMGFPEESLSSNYSIEKYNAWKKNDCQPNQWIDVMPDPTISCGPYKLPHEEARMSPLTPTEINADNHDTIGMISIDARGHIAVGVSTNGLRHKIPGRVGDSPIPGSGAYVDKDIGGAVATGNGDIMMRFAPSFAAVEYMRTGSSPEAAANASLQRIISYYPEFIGAVIAVNKLGEYGTACYGLKRTFEHTLRNQVTGAVVILSKACVTKR